MSHSSPLSPFLKRLLRQSELNAEEREAVLSLPTYVEEFARGSDIVSAGETVTHSSLIGRGLAARYDPMIAFGRQISAFHIEGDMCDLHSIVEPKAACGIAALTATSILRVPHAELRRLIAQYPAIASAFWRNGRADVSILAKWVSNLGRSNARARLAHLLCEMGMRMEVAGLARRDHFRFEVNQATLARAIGLSPVHVNRTLQALRRDGLIVTPGDRMRIPDWRRLATFAKFDPGYLLLKPTRVSQFDEESVA